MNDLPRLIIWMFRGGMEESHHLTIPSSKQTTSKRPDQTIKTQLSQIILPELKP